MLSKKPRTVISCASPPLTLLKTPLESSFCFHTKNRSSLLISSSAHDYSNVAWHHQPNQEHNQGSFSMKNFCANITRWEKLHRIWELKSFSHLHMRHGKLSRNLKGRVKKRKDFTICFYLRKVISLSQTRSGFYDNVLLTVNDIIMNRLKCRIKTAIILPF